MYRDDYHRDDFERDLDRPTLYSRDRDPFYEDRVRDRAFDFDDRERGLRSSYPPPPPPVPPLDDPYYRRLDELESRFSRSREPPLEPGAEVIGSVILIPVSPFEVKPKRREKPVNCDTVFVGSLPDNMTEKHLYDLFARCGKVSDVRISRGRNFGHVQFSEPDAIDLAVELSGCRVRILHSSLSDTMKLHVDYAQPKGEAELQKRIHEGELMGFTPQNASTVSSDLHRDEAFVYAAKNVIHWIERGNCNQSTSNTFFGLISSVNTHCRKVAKNIKVKDDEAADFMQKRRQYFGNFDKECVVLDEVFEAASQQKAWNHFTKPQRKTISQWKEFAAEVHATVESAMKQVLPGVESLQPPVKRARVEDTELEADLERAQKEIEQLKTDHEVALEKKDKQIIQLKTLLTRFKQSCPEEWEKAISGGKGKAKEDKVDSKGKKAQPLPPGVEEEKQDGENKGEVDLDDLSVAMEMGEGENSLAAAAAAYAKMRSTVGSTEPTGLGLTEIEVALVSVIATFLTVHPLGAPVEEITSYLKAFNPSCNDIYLESLMRRLPQVFQLSQSADGVAKWWFLGFQTCCNTGLYNIDQSQGGSTSTTTSQS